MIKLFIGPHCPECERLKPWIPVAGVEVIDTSTDEGYAEAMNGSIYSIPTILIDGKKLSGFWACRAFFMGE